MGLLKRLGYRVKRFLQGEEGIVQGVDLTAEELSEEEGFNCRKDDLGHLPQKVTIINPLGEFVILYSPPILVPVKCEDGRIELYREYKTYKEGERFP